MAVRRPRSWWLARAAREHGQSRERPGERRRVSHLLPASGGDATGQRETIATRGSASRWSGASRGLAGGGR
ncbi:sodium/potassium/calcium exchanger 3 isoform X4 [Sesbania bispinosa]|nr:sodium/potassium/calcium exchanger 3 isoform X4 [Sesbania bispinosa]